MSLSLKKFVTQCYNQPYNSVTKLKKDKFYFEIICNDEKIISNLLNFIHLEEVNLSIINETIKFYFCDYSTCSVEYDVLLNNSQIVKIHGGTKEQHMYANMYTEDTINLYRINSGKPQYVIYDSINNSYILLGNEQTLNFDLLRIVREVYYRNSLLLGRVAFHSAALVNSEGECVLISGDKGSGKSTLMCNILSSTNLAFLDNDRVMLGIDDDKIVAHSMSSTVNIAYGTLSNYTDFNVENHNAASTDKIKFSRFDFIQKLNCESNTSGIVKEIIFPQISADTTNYSYSKCELTELKERFRNSMEKLDNDEHPDWLNIANVNVEDYNKKIEQLIDNLKFINAYKVNYGYNLLTKQQIETFCII